MPRYCREGGLVTTWDKTQEFIDSCSSIIPEGGRTTYVMAENNPDERVSDSDQTSFIFSQAEWAEDNLPPIAFILDPGDEWRAFTESPLPKQKKDAQGQLMFEEFSDPGRDPRPLLDFPHLPDKISTAVHWFRPELWRRYDGRIGYQDIMMRMEQPRPHQTAFQMRVSRGRSRFVMASWHGCLIDNKSTGETRRKVIEGLTASQRANNTTRGSTPGLKDPLQGELGGRVPVPSLKSRFNRVRSRVRPGRPLSAVSPLIACSTPSSSNARITLDRDQLDRDQLRARLDERDERSYAGQASQKSEQNVRESSVGSENQKISEASKPPTVSTRSVRPQIPSRPYIPVLGLDFQNFIESRFATLDSDDTNPATGWTETNSSEPPKPSNNETNYRETLKSAPDLFVGDPVLDAVISNFFENDIEQSLSVDPRNSTRGIQVEDGPSRSEKEIAHTFPISSSGQVLRVRNGRTLLGDRRIVPSTLEVEAVTAEHKPDVLAENMKNRRDGSVENKGDNMMDFRVKDITNENVDDSVVNDVNEDVNDSEKQKRLLTAQTHATAAANIRRKNIPDTVDPSPQKPNRGTPTTRGRRFTRAPKPKALSSQFTRNSMGAGESDFDMGDFFDMDKYQRGE